MTVKTVLLYSNHSIYNIKAYCTKHLQKKLKALK